MAQMIGRYQVVRSLGKGAQGQVWLAQDPQLGRQVAIKTMLQQQNVEGLLKEARTVSQLQHPNIVTLYDLLAENGQHYMVLEYIEGETLDAWLKKNGALDPVRAVRLIAQVLEGLYYAHEQGVVHRDIKPANILLDTSGNARITDFGVAAARGSKQDGSIAGTPHYIAPEVLKGQDVETTIDIFAVGLVLHEMLTGRRAIQEENLYAVLNKVANLPIQAPSKVNPKVDQKLDHIVLTALLKNAQDRYPSARAMIEAIEAYLGQGETAGEEVSGSATLDFLLRRMRHTSDFPALSQAICSINKIADSDGERLQALSAVVLKDFALTNKLLRLVNSATFGQFGGGISTISRAVIILGFDTVRSLAVTLMLFEHLQNKTQAANLREEVARSFYCGLITRQLSLKNGIREIEESRICGMFHWLGKLLAAFYFHEEFIEIGKRVQQGQDESQVVQTILGISFEELGCGVGKAWNFPEKIIGSMRAIDGKPKKPQSDIERLRLMTNLGSELTSIMLGPPSEHTRKLLLLKERYKDAITLDEPLLRQWLADAASDYLEQAAYFAIDTRPGELLNRVKALLGKSGGAHAQPEADTLERTIIETAGLANVSIEAQDGQLVLSSGVQEITNALVSDFNLNDLIRMILEVMYRGKGFDHVLFAARDVKRNVLAARFGFGQNIDKLIPHFAIPLTQTVDVFRVAIEKNADILIEDVTADSIRERIPVWYSSHFQSKTFLILPVVIDKRAIGLFYADRAQAGALEVQPKELSLLKTLRNQAILGIRQKQVA